MQGMFHLYTGNGKGKTTAAIGQIIRSLGAGWRVFLGQFVKSMEYSEIKILKEYSNLTIRQYGKGCFIETVPAEEDIEAAQRGLVEMGEVLRGGNYQLVVLDEANIAIHFKLFSASQLLEVIEERAEGVEVVVTGRNAERELIERADLVTSMEKVKHYYQQGVLARDGIER